MRTLVHVTHEAVHQAGGIGTVLRGLITASAYGEQVQRTLLIGPLGSAESDPLGADGVVLYDARSGKQTADLTALFSPIETQYGTRLVYGRRRMRFEDRSANVEVVLIDTERAPNGLDDFKYYLAHEFGIDSRRYEHEWEYEHYLRLSEPGYAVIDALCADESGACHILAHEFMGLGVAYKAILAGNPRYKTLFYAHEVATVRPLIEDGVGGDIAFYNTLRRARDEGRYIESYYGDQTAYFKHALVRQAWRCDAVLAVGDLVVEELRFLAPEFAHKPIDLVYNGVPAKKLSMEEREAASEGLKNVCANLLGWAPEWVFTHVTRLVRSKGLWRDLLVLDHLDALLAARRQRAVLIALTSEVGRRSEDSVRSMAKEYAWPLVHREGGTDLSPGELEFDLQVRAFNARSRAVRVLFVNQFGWDRASCGEWMPEEMHFELLRQGSDVEFGQSIYEPFGIAQVEPLGFGAVSVVSDVCGCVGFVERCRPAQDEYDGFIIAPYTRMAEDVADSTVKIGSEQVELNEEAQSRAVAEAISNALRGGKRTRQARLRNGFATASAMSWERVTTDWLVPVLKRLE
jgi:glycosyltransferase involved in cell wall biosynthesis